jgi:O-methyltransferase involved in polyketide biosynthesis
MSDKVNVDLGPVQRTMFLPLWGRAVESRKKHPLLVDKKALEIMEKVDYDFSPIAGNINELSRFAWIVRSLIVDKTVREFLERHPSGTVVNLGCGMDTTFERVDNGQCRWYDLDMPDVIDLRRKFITPEDRRVFLSQSLLDVSWIDRIKQDAGVLLVAAGVLYYQKENEVKLLFGTIAGRIPGCELVADVASPFGVRAANRMVIKAGGLDEKSFLTWGIENIGDIATWDGRIKIIGTEKYFRGRWLHLKPRYWLMSFLSDFMKIQYIVHMRFGSRQ